GEPSKIAVKFLSLPDSMDLLVINDGKPISPENLSKIFERGFTTKEGSTGLGLAIAKKLVEAHDWRITIETAPTTTFRIAIPK
ncbi:MAG: ATP-binding protein, partial [Candidatus Hodarchaeota archaeon]